jgi:hypothetical protein
MNFEVNIEVGEDAQAAEAQLRNFYLNFAEGDSGVLTLRGTKENLCKSLGSLANALDSMTDPPTPAP